MSTVDPYVRASTKDAGDRYIERERALSNDPHGQTGQPLPKANEHPSVHELMVQDIRARAAFGLGKYGQPLRSFNGRDSLRDAYEEVLDLAVYIRLLTHEHNSAADMVEQLLKGCVTVFDELVAFLKEQDPEANAPAAVIAQRGIDQLKAMASLMPTGIAMADARKVEREVCINEVVRLREAARQDYKGTDNARKLVDATLTSVINILTNPN